MGFRMSSGAERRTVAAIRRTTAGDPSDVRKDCLSDKAPEGFPDRYVEAIFSTEDKDGRLLPMYELFSLVRRLVTEAPASPLRRRQFLHNLDRVVDRVGELRGSTLTSREQSRLLHLR